jgi:hypothetical protein
MKLFIIICFIFLNNFNLLSQSWEENMGSGMGEAQSRVNRNKVRREMKEMGYFNNPLPSYNFIAPPGWSVILSDNNTNTYMLGHTTIPGILLTTAHKIINYNELVSQSMAGINIPELQLNINGPVKKFNNNGISMSLIGYSNGTEVKGYLVSITNGRNGGVTILTFTSSQLFSNEHYEIVNSVANGIQYLN